jgi:hypothetical protein
VVGLFGGLVVTYISYYISYYIYIIIYRIYTDTTTGHLTRAVEYGILYSDMGGSVANCRRINGLRPFQTCDRV